MGKHYHLIRLLITAFIFTFISTVVWSAADSEESGAGATASSSSSGSMYSEAPMLAALVAKGELPPVEDRLPIEPHVLKMMESTGKYGDTMYVYATNNSPWNDLTEEPGGTAVLLRMGADGIIGPDVMKDCDLAADMRSLTCYMREGMKWNDGAPFTSADFTFSFYDMVRHSEGVGSREEGGISTWGSRAEIDNVVAVDDYTVRWEYNVPYPAHILDFVHWRGSDWYMYRPKHYLSKWHIDHNADANALAKEEGHTDWIEALNYHANFHPTKDIDRPRIHHWMFTNQTTQLKAFVRNPYFHQVDPDGKQLPYVDKVVSEIVDKETYDLKIVAGQSDVAFLSTSLDNFTLYKQNEDAGNYTTYLLGGVEGSEAAYAFNQQHKDPVRRELYQNVNFRRAMSLGIDRNEINRVAYNGMATPRMASVLPNTTFYDANWAENHAYVGYDPDRANEMLDAIGNINRGSDGVRRDANGKKITITIEYASIIHQGIALAHELVKEFWEDLGFEVQVKEVGGSLWGERRRSVDIDTVSTVVHGLEMYSMGGLGGFHASNPGKRLWLESHYAVLEGRSTLEDFGGTLPGTEPTAEELEMVTMKRNVKQLEYGGPQYLTNSAKYWQWMSDNVWVIGTVGMAQVPFIARSNLRNIPIEPHPWFEETLNYNYFASQFYFD